MLCVRNNARVFGSISPAKITCSPSPDWRGNCGAQHLATRSGRRCCQGNVLESGHCVSSVMPNASLQLLPKAPGSQGMLPHPSPLRTVHESLPSHGSSPYCLLPMSLWWVLSYQKVTEGVTRELISSCLSAAHRNCLASLARGNRLFLQVILFRKPRRYF